MCRLFAITANRYIPPTKALLGMEAMREGYDGSGVGILLKDLGGPFESMKSAPILSGIFSAQGLKRLDTYMLNMGFMTKYKISFPRSKYPPNGVPKRDIYLIRAYDMPGSWEALGREEIADRLMSIRLELRRMGRAEKDMIVFSFWPDTIMIKEIGDPVAVANYLGLDRREFHARIIMAQGRQNTNYDIDLYACHPFFLQGYATMTNGENTAYIANRDFLVSRGFQGYNGYRSDSEVFTHILHYSMKKLGMEIEAYKHIITPLQDDILAVHPDREMLKHLKHSCRRLIIDGPNCVIGCLPDNSLFMVQDRKKLRPGVVGGKPGLYAFSSEICGLDAAIPDRVKSEDFQPMHMDTAIIKPNRKRVEIARQTDRLPFPN